MASSVAADLDRILDDPDQLPVEAHQLMSSLRRDAPNLDHDLPAQLRQLRKQLQRKEEEMKERDAAMQQLLRGADRIEDVQRSTLAQLADAQSEVLPNFQDADHALPKRLQTIILQTAQCSVSSQQVSSVRFSCKSPHRLPCHGMLLVSCSNTYLPDCLPAFNASSFSSSVCSLGGRAHSVNSGDQPAQSSSLEA